MALNFIIIAELRRKSAFSSNHPVWWSKSYFLKPKKGQKSEAVCSCDKSPDRITLNTKLQPLRLVSTYFSNIMSVIIWPKHVLTSCERKIFSWKTVFVGDENCVFLIIVKMSLLKERLLSKERNKPTRPKDLAFEGIDMRIDLIYLFGAQKRWKTRRTGCGQILPVRRKVRLTHSTKTLRKSNLERIE